MNNFDSDANEVYDGKLYLVTVIALSQTPLKYSLIGVDGDEFSQSKGFRLQNTQGYRKVELTNVAEMDEDGNIYLCFLCNERSSDGIDYYYIQYVKFDGEKIRDNHQHKPDIRLSDLTLVPNPTSIPFQLKHWMTMKGISTFLFGGVKVKSLPYHTGNDIDVITSQMVCICWNLHTKQSRC